MKCARVSVADETGLEQTLRYCTNLPLICPTALPITFRNLFTEICVLKRWEKLTVKATVIAAASAFKRNIRKSIVDPYAICPEVDGRITNVEEAAAA